MPDRTETQSADEQREAEAMSRRRTAPPTTTPGYQLRRFLGAGAYGEVWVGVDETTGRQVAVKFYTHKGGVDWSLLNREVEKLVFLSADRYVVQLLDVGWDAEPPYYVMDYIEHGSLDDLLTREGTLPTEDVLTLFREVALGLRHAHGKGVLHCDLKPGNVLLDQDRNPRLADFGQSRLSHEQTPALGTLFYMAPEQADLKAVPDARWDVYALGALVFCMLTGEPPHRNEANAKSLQAAGNLEERLAIYRNGIQSSPLATEHRKVPGVDGMLADIIDRCLAPNPKKRFTNVQEVLDALHAREASRARRPLLMFGVMGPILLLTVMGLFGWRGFNQALSDSRTAVVERVRKSNSWAAKHTASSVSADLQKYFNAVEEAANNTEFQRLVEEAVTPPEVDTILDQLTTLQDEEKLAPLRDELTAHESRNGLQAELEHFLVDDEKPLVATWFVVDKRGNSIAIAFPNNTGRSTVGKNFAFRTYFHGGPSDLPDTVRPPEVKTITETHLSALFPSRATNAWKVAVSTPIEKDGELIGILALTIELGNFVEFASGKEHFAVLVDGRPGETQGVILQHPLFDEVLANEEKLPDRFAEYRVPLEEDWSEAAVAYQDPLGADRLGKTYQQDWIAALASVDLDRSATRRDSDNVQPSGLYVLVQESRAEAVAPVSSLGWRLAREGLAALAVIMVMVGCLWYFVFRSMNERRYWLRPRRSQQDSSFTPVNEMETIGAAPRRKS